MDGPWLRIEEVAEAVGLTVRTIRLYQTEGLLPAPRREGRTALYGPDHVARLRVVADLRDHGFGLEAIRRSLGQGVAAGDLREFARLAREGSRPGPPVTVPLSELSPAGGEPMSEEIARWAIESGLYRPLPDGMVEIVCPALHEAGQDLGAIGLPFAVRRELAEAVLTHADAIAHAMVETVYEHALRPLLDPEGDAADAALAEEHLERLRPLAMKAVAGYFPVAMAKAIDALAARELPPDVP